MHHLRFTSQCDSHCGLVSTMGWELRVFCPAESAKNILIEDAHKERREDEYIVVSSRVGLKMRGREKLGTKDQVWGEQCLSWIGEVEQGQRGKC